MKLTAFFLLITMTLCCQVAFAETAASAPLKQYQWDDKLARGVVNIFTSPIEVIRQVHLTTREESMAKGWTVGLIQGIGQGVVRFGTGVIDAVTFPFNFPDKNKAPLVEPEYVWDKPGPKVI